MQFLPLLLPIVIALSWARLIRPGSSAAQGNVLFNVRLPLLARLRMHTVPSALILALSIFLVLDGLMPAWLLIVPVISIVLMIGFPVRYLLTDQGIRLGRTSFHRWTEFSGVRRARGGAKLIGIQRSFGYRIWLSGSRGDDEFLHFLRQTIKNAYKGHYGQVILPRSEQREQRFDANRLGHQISAMTRDV